MQITGNYKFKSAIIITPEKLRELDGVVRKYFPSEDCSAKTLNGNKIEFDDLDELLNYDNFSKHKIKDLRLTYGYKNAIQFDIGESFLFGFAYTVEIDYVFAKTEDEAHFLNAVSHVLSKMKAPYAILSKFKAIHLLILSGLLLLYMLFTQQFTKVTVEITGAYIITVLLFAFGTNFIGSLINKFWTGLFPPIVFSWGEEENKFNRMEKRRGQLFWSVLVAVLVGVIVFFITNPFS